MTGKPGRPPTPGQFRELAHCKAYIRNIGEYFNIRKRQVHSFESVAEAMFLDPEILARHEAAEPDPKKAREAARREYWNPKKNDHPMVAVIKVILMQMDREIEYGGAPSDKTLGRLVDSINKADSALAGSFELQAKMLMKAATLSKEAGKPVAPDDPNTIARCLAEMRAQGLPEHLIQEALGDYYQPLRDASVVDESGEEDS